MKQCLSVGNQSSANPAVDFLSLTCGRRFLSLTCGRKLNPVWDLCSLACGRRFLSLFVALDAQRGRPNVFEDVASKQLSN